MPNQDRPTIKLQIENIDLNALVTEYAQENANLRLAQKALVRRINEMQVEAAAVSKKEAKADAVDSPQEGR